MSQLDDELVRMKGYSYRIWGYGLGHSELIIRATHNNEKHHNTHISFIQVYYFQFPLAWTGDLFPAPDDELLEILIRAGIGNLDKVLPITVIKEFYHLYKANTPNSTVYILGHLSQIEYDVEPVYN